MLKRNTVIIEMPEQNLLKPAQNQNKKEKTKHTKIKKGLFDGTASDETSGNGTRMKRIQMFLYQVLNTVY